VILMLNMMLKKIIFYVLGHIWLQIWYLAIIQLENLVFKMHYKLIQEGHMFNLVFEKDLDLATSGSFYCDYTTLNLTKFNLNSHV
jgi:hypothetical protein